MSIQYQGRALSEAEALTHVWDVEEVMEVMNRRAYYAMQGRHAEELTDLWVSSSELQKSASLGGNYGYYCGMSEVRRYYVDEFQAQRQEILDDFCAEDPSIENVAENRMIGYTAMAPNSTPLVEIAADGKTAQGVWYTIAQETTGRAGGRSYAIWRGEKLAADFAKEPDGWKIWHLVIANDYFNPAGTPHEAQPLDFPPGEDPRQIAFGTPTVAKLLHDSRLHWSDNYPPEPVPYLTYDASMGYGPEGWRTAIRRPEGAISPQRLARGEKRKAEARAKGRGPRNSNGPGGPGGPPPSHAPGGDRK